MHSLKVTSLFILIATSSTLAHPFSRSSNEFEAPGADAVRGPCPALNIIANYGYIQRDGKNITSAQLTSGLSDAMNVDPTMGGAQALAAMQKLGRTDPVSGETVLDLSDLSKHNVLEHDASLSRQDAGLGNNTVINSALVDQLVSFSSDGGRTISVSDIAAARHQRDIDMKNEDPLFSMSALATFQAYHEASQLMTVLKDSNGDVRVDWIREWLGQERLPTDLGWTKPASSFGWPSTLALATEIRLKVDVLDL